MREQKANDNGFPVVGKQAKEQQIFPFEQLVEYDGATNKITINANLTINGDTNIGELDIDSGDAPKGQVLTANGQSGASWENRVEYLNLENESGNLTNAQIEVVEQDNVVIQLGGQFYYKNSQSDEAIVFKAPAKVVDDDTIVEKVVVDLSDNTYSYSYEVIAAGNSFEPTYDDEINDSSTNAPQTKVVYEALEEKANVDGNYPTLTSGLADNLVATNGLTTTNSFIMEETGGDQASAVSTGNMNLTLRGNSVVVNQSVKDFNMNDWRGSSGTSFSVSNGILSMTASGLYGRVFSNISLIANHKYLVLVELKTATETDKIRVGINNVDAVLGYLTRPCVATTNWQTIVYIAQPSSVVESPRIVIADVREENWDTVQIRNALCIDLTQWFNGDIPQDILDHPEKFINYYQGSLAYNTGHIENAQSTSLISRGINQWDEEWELGAVEGSGGATTLRSKNYIRVLPNTEYYIKSPRNGVYFVYDKDKNYIESHGFNGNNTFTTEQNACFMLFCLTSDYGTTYKHDICINVSNTDINGNYYEYEKNETSLGNDVLRSVKSVYDSKAPNGLIARRIGAVDLGTLDWTTTSVDDNPCFVATISDKTYTSNAICSKYSFSSRMSVDKTFTTSIGSPKQVYIRDSAYNNTTTFKAAMSGVYLYYELAEYTEEQGTPFAENIKVVKGGTLEFVGNGIPQGNSMFFQKNLKSFLEAFGTAINYDPSRIERLANLSFTPETADIVLNPAPANAYAKVQVMSSTFTIVVSAALTGTASGSITFQDSEVDLTNFQTKPAEAIYDMDGKKVSEAPTTTDCNIASFVGRSYNGVVLWSILHSGVNKIKIHFEQAVPLDENGNGKVDCRASLIL